MVAKYPSIPEPTIKAESLRDAVLTIKQAFEVLTGQRGNQDYRAVLLPELTAGAATKVSKSGDAMTGSLTVGPAKVNQVGDIGAARVDAPTTGAYYFGNTGSKVLYFNGADFSFWGGSVLPAVNGTQNLGNASVRWGTVYTSDLDLSNGIGDWTIVEGEDDLFIYNNKRGKTYKFALIEVDHAPPKKV